MDHILLDIKDLNIFFELINFSLNFLVIFRIILQLFQRFQSIVICLIKITTLQLSMSQLTKHLKIPIILFNFILIVFNASIVFLGDKQDITIILDLVECLEAVFVILDNCFIMGVELTRFSSEKG